MAEAQEERRPRRRQLEQDIRELQAENLRKEQQLRQLGEELEVFRDNNPQGARGEPGVAHESTESTRTRLKRCAASAGRRASIMHMPFMDADYLFDHRVQAALPRLIADVKKASLDPDDPEADREDEGIPDEDNPRLYWEYYRFEIPDALEMVREVLYHLPPNALDRWLKGWFKDAFLDGHRKIRGDVVFHVAKNHNLIFGISDVEFRNKQARAVMAQAQELRNTFQYSFLNGRPDIKSFYRHKCILGTVRYIFSGESAIATGERSKKARNAHSSLWHATQVTPSVLAFAATVIDFVLSGEPSFEQVTAKSNYSDFFKGRLSLMRQIHEAHPDEFEELMLYFNRSVFPGAYPAANAGELEDEDGCIAQPNVGMTQADMAFIEGL